MYKSYAGIDAILYLHRILFHQYMYFNANYNSKKARINSYLGEGVGIYVTKCKYHVNQGEKITINLKLHTKIAQNGEAH